MKGGTRMFIGNITYKEAGKVEKMTIRQEDVFKLLAMLSKFNDLSITELHIYKE
jgi:hypothetical protein